MGRQLSLGNPPITVDLRVSKRAKRLSLRVSRLDGKVSLTMPPYGKEKEAIRFLEEREEWLRKHLVTVKPESVPQIGGAVLIDGTDTPIVAGSTKCAKLEGGVLYVPNLPDVVGAKVKAFLKLRARDALAAASDTYAKDVGRSYKKLSLRDTRSRWGSCSTEGVLMYSWRLVMAPVDVLNYVAAHEVSHLVEMNHSQAFWDVVAELMPDYAVHRRWLRENGDQLHRVQFGS